MENVSLQLAGKLITGLPPKWSTGESVGCGRAAGDIVQPSGLLGRAQTLRGAALVPCLVLS